MSTKALKILCNWRRLQVHLLHVAIIYRSSSRLRAQPSESKYSSTVRSRTCISSDLWCIQVTDKQPGMQMTSCRWRLAVLNQNVSRPKKQFGYLHHLVYRFFKLLICILVGVIKVDASMTDSPIRWGCTRRRRRIHLPWWGCWLGRLLLQLCKGDCWWPRHAQWDKFWSSRHNDDGWCWCFFWQHMHACMLVMTKIRLKVTLNRLALTVTIVR